jgi:hypothetical protein
MSKKSTLTLHSLKLDHNSNRSKNLFFHNFQVMLHVSEDCRIDETSLRAEAIATEVTSSSFILTRIDVSHNAVILDLGNLGALVGFFTERISEFDLIGSSREPLQKFIIYSCLNKDSRACTASPAVIPTKKNTYV